jgi:hypothetical protein
VLTRAANPASYPITALNRWRQLAGITESPFSVQ